MGRHAIGPMVATLATGLILGALVALYVSEPRREDAERVIANGSLNHMSPMSVKAWEKPHFSSSWVTYNIALKTGAGTSDGTKAQVDVQLGGHDEDGNVVTSSWHTLRDAGVGFQSAALDEFDIMDMNLGIVDTMKFRSSTTDQWKPDWARIAFGDKETHFEEMACISSDTTKCAVTEFKMSTRWTAIIKIADDADAGAAGPFTVRWCGVDKSSTCSPYYTLDHTFAPGDIYTFTRYWHALSTVNGGALGRVTIRGPGGKCTGGICPRIEWMDVRVGEDEPGQHIFTKEVGSTLCNTGSTYCNLDGWDSRVKETAEEDNNKLQHQIDSLKSTMDKVTYQQAVEIATPGLVTYTITISTRSDKGATSAQIDMSIAGAEGTVDWITLSDTGYSVGEVKSYEVRRGFIGVIQSASFRSSTSASFWPAEVTIRVGEYPFWEQYQWTSITKRARKGSVNEDPLVLSDPVKNTYGQIESLQSTVDELTYKVPVKLDTPTRVKYTATVVTKTTSTSETNGEIYLGVEGTDGVLTNKLIAAKGFASGESATFEWEDKYIGSVKTIRWSVGNTNGWCPDYITVAVGEYPGWTQHRFTPLPCTSSADNVREAPIAKLYNISITALTDQTYAAGWKIRWIAAGSATWSPWVKIGDTIKGGEPLNLLFYTGAELGGDVIERVLIATNDGAAGVMTVSTIELRVGEQRTRFVIPDNWRPDGCADDAVSCDYRDARGATGKKITQQVYKIKNLLDLEKDNEDMQRVVDATKGVMGALARASINAQFATEQRVSSEGGSGVVRVRSHSGGDAAYYDASFVGASVLAMHEHANNVRTIGMGEFTAVMNGVYFATRHNDYSLKSASRTSTDFKAVEDIEFPPLPSELSGKSVDQQVDIMRDYFRAWWQQDSSIKDYKPYFQPVLCYLETWWEKKVSDDVQEPFASDRHVVEANGWKDLYSKTMYLWSSGRKNNNENLPFLPSAVKDTDSDDLPVFANYQYRILCHKLENDLPLNRFRIAEDWHSMKNRKKSTFDQMKTSRSGRFELNPRDQDRWHTGSQGYELIDKLMGEIPGLNNYGAQMTDDSFGATLVHAITGQPLNVAYYSRYYAADKDAMGRSMRRRGFNDPNLFVAQTTQAQVMPFTTNEVSKKGSPPVLVTQRTTYASPLEIIYMTPLSQWNPYNLEWKGKAGTPEGDVVTENGRTGHTTDASKAYNGINSKVYYITPAAFFNEASGGDAADTAKGSAGILDKQGNIRLVRPSGHRIMLPEIAGVGVVRQRWPIPFVHEAGSTAWKEIKAIQSHIFDGVNLKGVLTTGAPPPPSGHNFLLAEGGTGHQHTLDMAAGDVEDLKAGISITMTSEERNMHQHVVTMTKSSNGACPSGAHKWTDKAFDATGVYCWTMTLEEPHLLECRDCS